jgi:hypothetical protein
MVLRFEKAGVMGGLKGKSVVQELARKGRGI